MLSYQTRNKYLFIFFAFAFTFLYATSAFAQDFEWVKSAGGPTRTTAIYPRGIHVDGVGNSYVTGGYYGQTKFDNVDLDPTTDRHQGDVFLAKYDPSGKLLWVKRDGGSGTEFAQDIAVDPQGNIYIMGFFSKVFDDRFCEIGGVKLESKSDEHEYFLAKYDAEGKLKWVQQSKGNGHNIESEGKIDLDYQGNIILQGSFKGEMKIGGIQVRNDGKSFSLFVSKFNSNGVALWATSHIENIDFDKNTNPFTKDFIRVKALTIDNSGNIYYTGEFKGILKFSGERAISKQSDVFMVKLGADGKQIWYKVIGNNNYDDAADIKIDSKENPYLLFHSSNPVIGNVSNSKGYGTFVAKFDKDGKAYQITSLIEDALCTDMAIDKEDRIYAIGHYTPTGKVDCVVLQSTGIHPDVFFISQDASGNLQWIKEVKGIFGKYALDIKLDGFNNAYGLGLNRGDVYFDNQLIKNVGGANVEEQGAFTDDMFLAKINNIDIYAPPSPFKLVCSLPQSAIINTSIALTARVENEKAPVSYTWELGNGERITTQAPSLNYTFKLPGSFTISIVAKDNLGCVSICKGTVQVLEQKPEDPESPGQGSNKNIKIPNIFTPNGDGINDVFTVANYNKNTPLPMKIYNRWGALVIDLKDGVDGWDGKKCSEGLYFYLLRIEGEEIKGWVELVR